jgi:hypothetical protein
MYCLPALVCPVFVVANTLPYGAESSHCAVFMEESEVRLAQPPFWSYLKVVVLTPFASCLTASGLA